MNLQCIRAVRRGASARPAGGAVDNGSGEARRAGVGGASPWPPRRLHRSPAPGEAIQITSQAQPLIAASSLLRQQLERAREAGADADCAEVAPIGGQNSVDLAPLGKSGDSAVDQSKTEVLEPGVEFQSPHQI